LKSRTAPHLFTLFVIYLALHLFGIGCNTKQIEYNTDQSAPLFKLVDSSHSKIDFNNVLVENLQVNHLNYEYVYSGAGVAVGDINNDGLEDLYFTSNQGQDQLYVNKGNLEFENITNSAFQDSEHNWSTGVTMADVNGDGWLDIYVSKSGWYQDESRRKNLLYINNKNLTFTESADTYGLGCTNHNMQSAFFDYDKDGDLDMYAMGHPADMFGLKIPIKEYLALVNQGAIESDQLFQNNDGVFIDVSAEAGIKDYGYGLGVVAGDINDDGWTDIYISNDYEEPDILYINNKDGTFSDKIKSWSKHISNFSMGVDIADFNNDLLADVFTADMSFDSHERSKRNMPSMNPALFWTRVAVGWHFQYMSNALQMNTGNSTFSEIAQLAGVNKTDWSWSALFADFDLDGLKDLSITNGVQIDMFDNDVPSLVQARTKNGEITLDQMLDLYPSSKRENYLYKNQGDLTFKNVSSQWGFTEKVNSNGAAYADLDNDGDLDYIINNLNDVSHIYENRSNEINNNAFVKFRLEGSDKNTGSIGSKIIIWAGAVKQIQEVQPTRGYLSRVTSSLLFGLGEAKSIDSIQITWPDNSISKLYSLEVNKEYVFEEDKIHKKHISREEIGPKLIPDIAANLGLDIRHIENRFDDYKKQVLLPHAYSQNGPALSIGDINNDGLEDIYIGGAHTYPGHLLTQDLSGLFKKVNGPWENHQDYEDVGSIFIDVDSDGDEDLYVVSGGYEHEEGHPLYLDRLYINDGSGKFMYDRTRLPQFNISGQSIATGDIDSDGDIDIFIGGRVSPWKYPKSPQSYILINEAGKFSLSHEEEFASSDMGMVTGSELIDIDNDEDLDLLVVGEWMSPMIFENVNGQLSDATKKYGLEKSIGWWYSVLPGDVDGDGDIDFIAGNLGKNHKFKASEDHPLHIYYDDFDQNQTLDAFLAHEENEQILPYRGRECSSEQLPYIADKYADFSSFATASIHDILDIKTEDQHKVAYAMESAVFLNNGDKSFQKVILPNECQFAPVTSIVSLFNEKKANESSYLLSGNQLDVEVETILYDASQGCIITINKNGEVTCESNLSSGLYLPYNIRNSGRLNINDRGILIVGSSNDYLRAYDITNLRLDGYSY